MICLCTNLVCFRCRDIICNSSYKKIAVLVESPFEESELIYPYHRLSEDFDVVIVGSEKDVEYPSKAGYKVKSDISSKEAYPSEFDGVYIPGAYSPDGMRKHEATINFVKKFHENGKSIAAVCHGPWVVSDAGLLDGVKASSTPYYQKGLDKCWCEMGR